MTTLKFHIRTNLLSIKYKLQLASLEEHLWKKLHEKKGLAFWKEERRLR